MKLAKKCPKHVAPDRFVASDRSVPNSAVEPPGL